MRLTETLKRGFKVCLNLPEWDRRIWETGYRGSPLPKMKATGQKPRPISQNSTESLRKSLLREWNVMQWLANPYITEEEERPYVMKYGNILDQWAEQKISEKQARMPSKPKKYKIIGGIERKTANVGNLLHRHRTVEEQLSNIILNKRWD